MASARHARILYTLLASLFGILLFYCSVTPYCFGSIQAVFHIRRSGVALPLSVNVSNTLEVDLAEVAVEKTWLITRSFLSPRGSGEYISQFHPGWQLFASKVLHHRPIIVLDKGTNMSRAEATFSMLPTFQTPRLRVSNRTTAGMRRGGYDLQQLDTFFMDTWVPASAEVLAVFDTDSSFYSIPTPTTLFDSKGRPRVVGGSRLCCGFRGFANGTNNFLRQPEIGHFMMQFPMLIRRSTLINLRKHLEALHGAPFETLFQRIHDNRYSQFNIIYNFAWYHERDLYSWHFQDMPARIGGEPALFYRNLSFRHMFHNNGDAIGHKRVSSKLMDACSVYFGTPTTEELTRHMEALFDWEGGRLVTNNWLLDSSMTDRRKTTFKNYLDGVHRGANASQLKKCQDYALGMAR